MQQRQQQHQAAQQQVMFEQSGLAEHREGGAFMNQPSVGPGQQLAGQQAMVNKAVSQDVYNGPPQQAAQYGTGMRPSGGGSGGGDMGMGSSGGGFGGLGPGGGQQVSIAAFLMYGLSNRLVFMPVARCLDRCSQYVPISSFFCSSARDTVPCALRSNSFC